MAFLVSFLMIASFIEELCLYVVQFLRKIDIVTVRVLKPLNLIPERIDFLHTVFPYLLHVGKIIHQFSVLEHLHHQFSCGEILHCFLLPWIVLIKDRKRLILIYSLIIHTDLICDRFSRLLVIQTVDLLEVRGRYLDDILAYLDPGMNDTVGVLYGSKLVYSSVSASLS